jgi:DNA-binding SARP family transcriptional activator
VARLGELRAVAREQLLAARLDSGESAVLVPEIEALVTEQPLREERWRLLVLALYRAHGQGDALAALRRARQTLADELGKASPALRSPIVRPGAGPQTVESHRGAGRSGRPGS